MHKQNIIRKQKTQTIICRQLFAAHVVGTQPMKSGKNPSYDNTGYSPVLAGDLGYIQSRDAFRPIACGQKYFMDYNTVWAQLDRDLHNLGHAWRLLNRLSVNSPPGRKNTTILYVPCPREAIWFPRLIRTCKVAKTKKKKKHTRIQISKNKIKTSNVRPRDKRTTFV